MQIVLGPARVVVVRAAGKKAARFGEPPWWNERIGSDEGQTMFL